MGLQVGRLSVHFSAAGNVAGVDVLLSQMCSGRTQPLRFLTVGTVARGPARVPPLRARRRHLRQRRLRQAERGAVRHGLRRGQAHLVRVLQQMLAAGQQVRGRGGGQAGAQRVVGAGRVRSGDLGVQSGGSGHVVQPGAGGGGLRGGGVHVPPGRVGNFGFDGGGVHAEGPRLIRVRARVHGAQVRGVGGVHLAQELVAGGRGRRVEQVVGVGVGCDGRPLVRREGRGAGGGGCRTGVIGGE